MIKCKEFALIAMYAFLTYQAIAGTVFVNRIIFASTSTEDEDFETQCAIESGYVEKYIGISYCLEKEK